MFIAVFIKIALALTGIITAILAVISLSKRNTTPMFSVIWIIFGSILVLTGIFIEPYNWSKFIGIPTIILIGILSLSLISFLWYLTKKIDELNHKFSESIIQLTLLNNRNEELSEKIEKLNKEIGTNNNTLYDTKKNQNILFVNNTLSTGGAEIALLDQLEYYSKNNNVYLYIMTGMGELIHKVPKNVVVLNENFDSESVLTDKGQKKLLKKVLSAETNSFTGFRLAGYNIRALANMIRTGKIYSEKLAWRAIAETSPIISKEFDLAIAFTEGASTYYVADKVAAKQKIAWVHTNFKLAGYTKQLDKNSYDSFNKIYAVSKKVREEFLSIHPECLNIVEVKNIKIQKNKIEFSAKQKMEKDVWSENQKSIKILSVGRLVKLKSYENMINAAKILKDKSYNFIWVVLGEGPERNKLQNLIKQLELQNNFILLGFINNPYPYYKNCDIFVNASSYEGRSLAVQEAKSFECHIVLSQVDGNDGEIDEDINGVYCEINPNDIAEKIQTLIKKLV